MIDFASVIWPLAIKLGNSGDERAELSTDLVLSWICWQGKKMERPERPKPIVKVYWEQVMELSDTKDFNYHLQEKFDLILREAGDIKSKWTMLSTSIGGTAVWSCKVSSIGHSDTPLTRW